MSKHQVKSFPSDCPVMLGITTLYFRILLIWRRMPMVCSAFCSVDVVQSSQGGSGGFWSPARSPAPHRHIYKLVLSIGTKEGPTKMHLPLDAEMVTMAKTESCSGFGRVIWGSCFVITTLPLTLLHAVNLCQRQKTGIVHLPLQSPRIRSAWACLAGLCS